MESEHKRKLPPEQTPNFSLNDISMELHNINKKVNVTPIEVKVKPNYFTYEGKVVFYVYVKENSVQELVCLDGKEVPKYVHVMLNDEEIELEAPKKQYYYMKSDKTIDPKIAKTVEFIETYGEEYYEIKQISNEEGWTKTVFVINVTWGIKKVVILEIEKIREIEFYDCGFVRVKISENIEYLIEDKFGHTSPFREHFIAIL